MMTTADGFLGFFDGIFHSFCVYLFKKGCLLHSFSHFFCEKFSKFTKFDAVLVFFCADWSKITRLRIF